MTKRSWGCHWHLMWDGLSGSGLADKLQRSSELHCGCLQLGGGLGAVTLVYAAGNWLASFWVSGVLPVFRCWMRLRCGGPARTNGLRALHNNGSKLFDSAFCRRILMPDQSANALLWWRLDREGQLLMERPGIGLGDLRLPVCRERLLCLAPARRWALSPGYAGQT